MKIIKKIPSLISITTLLFQSFLPIVIAQEEPLQKPTAEVIEPSTAEVVGTGNLEIDVKFALPIRNVENTNVGFRLYDEKNDKVEIKFNEMEDAIDNQYQLGNQKVEISIHKRDKDGYLLQSLDEDHTINYYSITVYGLEKGTYSIEFFGKNYQTYRVDDIVLDKYSKRISFSNEAGMFAIGDLNKDNVIDNKDVEIMIAAIEEKNTEYDLNLDAKVDIADLNYITANIFSSPNEAKIVDTTAILDSKDIQLEIPEHVENITVQGSANDLLTDDTIVGIAHTNGEAISAENPVEIAMELKDHAVQMSEIRIETGIDNVPENLDIIVTDENGKETVIPYVKTATQNIYYFTDKASPNTIVIDLKGEIAVKKVTIRIKETSSTTLAEIAKVEFLNNVYEEVPKPDIQAPTGLNVKAESEKIIVNFDKMPNVTGYEILIEEIEDDKVVKTDVYQTTYTTMEIVELDNYTEYQVSVRSTNEDWRSDYSETTRVTPIPTRVPPAVDMVTLKPVYAGLDISWKDMKDTLSYNLFYREKGTKEYIAIRNITGTSYRLRNLKIETEYEVYLTGNNDLGEGKPSNIALGKTQVLTPVITPKYKLINTANGVGVKNNHILDVELVDNTGFFVAGDKFSIVDNDPLSYWQKSDWTNGAHYAQNAPVVTLDNNYEMKDFVIEAPDDLNSRYYVAKINYWYEGEKTTLNANIEQRRDENNKLYYYLKAERKFTANKVQIMVSTYGSVRPIQYSELKFYYYDSLEDDVAALFKDDLRVELADGVTLDKIEELEAKAKETDTESGEVHPYQSVILNDLAYAKKILQDNAIQDTIVVDQNISNAKNNHLGFAMSISDYQPLGIVARPGETLTVYVGSTGNVGALQLVFTQYYAEANVWSQTVTNLKKGQNVIDVPKIGSMQDERGGSVYIRYNSATPTSPIKVRVSGGHKIPVLNIASLTGETEKKEVIKTYIDTLQNYVASLPSLYEQDNLEYNEKTSVLNATEIVTEYGLFSVSASAIDSAIRTGLTTIEEKTDRVYNSLEAFDEMMELFYRQKGLKKNATDPADEIPASRVNIRYMRMFDGAFMYAGGYHVGIEFGSIGGLVQGKPNSNGITTGYFGWGISHEVGHQINQGNLVFAEVTNNIYSLLAQTSDDKALSRLEVSNLYPKIYEKVTSHTTGRSPNVFVQLAMYWQLHLAYDDEATFTDENSIFAKINHLSRTVNHVGSKDDLLVMYASEAAGKNLVPFFEAWGLKISDAAKTFASNFEEETRKIEYLNDEARRYRINGGSAMSDVHLTAQFNEKDSQNKRYTLEFHVDKDEDKILGYEILRNGESIMFTESNTFTDIIGAVNNQAFTYEVIAYDYLLNKTAAFVLPEVKVRDDGRIAKDNFTIESNVKAPGEITDLEDDTFDADNLSVNRLIDSVGTTFFHGTEKVSSIAANGNKLTANKDDGDAYVVINLNTKLSIAGITYQGATENGELLPDTIKDYKIYVSTDNTNWTLAKEGSFDLNSENNYTNTVYFDKVGTTGGNQLWTYNNITYVKIESVGNKNGLSGAEIEIIAPPGDNVDFTKDTIGVLKHDFAYDSSDESKVIEAGSVVIKGDYRGNPAFNVMLIVDSKDASKIYEGDNFLFAKLNNEKEVYEIANGTWFYVVSKEEYEKMQGKSIRANLYRVNDAETLEGQRLTSTSLTVSDLPLYEDLKEMEIVDTSK